MLDEVDKKKPDLISMVEQFIQLASSAPDRISFSSGPVLELRKRVSAQLRSPLSPEDPVVGSPIQERAEEIVRDIHFILFARGVVLDTSLFVSEAAERVQELLALLQDHMAPVEGPREVDVVDASLPDALSEIGKYAKNGRIVVVKNFPCDAWDWTPEWFHSRFGDERFPLADLTADAAIAGEPLPLRLVFEEPDRYFFANSQLLFDRNPDLSKSMNLRRMEDAVLPAGFWPLSQQFFVSTGLRAQTPMHNGHNGNFYFNIQGRKRWRLIDPDFSHLLYAWLRPIDGTSAADTIDGIWKSRFPLLNFVPYYEVTLEPGDILWNPYYWWHAVDALSDNNLAVSTRWVGGPGKVFRDPCPVITLTARCSPIRRGLEQEAQEFAKANPGKKFNWFDRFAHGRELFGGFGTRNKSAPWGVN